MTYLALISFMLEKLDKVLNSEERPENENSTFFLRFIEVKEI